MRPPALELSSRSSSHLLYSKGDEDRKGSWLSRQWVQFEFFVYSNHLQSVISKGVSESRVFRSPFTPAFGENGQISGRVALRDLVFTCQNKRSLAPIRALKTARPHGRDLGMTI